MRKTLVTAATEEAVSLDYVKDSVLRVTGTDDDERISALIRAAVSAYQHFTGRVLLSSTWDVYYDAFADELELPSPLTSVTSVKYQDTTDTQQTLAATVYQVDTVSEPARLQLAYGQVWPTTYGELNDVVIRCVSGYVNAASIPEDIRLGLYFWIQEQYDGTPLRAAYEACWWPLRIVPL